MSRTTRRRPGYALIELLVLLTVMTVMLGLCAGMIHILLKLDRVARSTSDEAADMARLARDFCADGHGSGAMAPATPSSGEFRLTLDGGRTVLYQARSRDILRTVREGDKVRSRELYRRPIRSDFRFELNNEGAAMIASIVIEGQGAGKEGLSPGRNVRIDAALGLDRRFHRGPE